MPDLSRSEVLAYAACAVLVALLGWRALRADGSTAASAGATVGTPARASAPASARGEAGAGGGGPEAVTVGEAPRGPALVDVVGAVRRPGVYRLRVGQRVQDAIRLAGGPRGNADLQAINLAAKVADAQQIVVPVRARAGAAGAAGAQAEATAGAAAGASAGSPAATAPAGGPVAPVNLNTATAEQLDTLDGVGPATAQKILEYRQQHGGFSSVEDLAQVSGIGPKRLAALRAQVQV